MVTIPHKFPHAEEQLTDEVLISLSARGPPPGVAGGRAIAPRHNALGTAQMALSIMLRRASRGA
jgi:hypothetical protein